VDAIPPIANQRFHDAQPRSSTPAPAATTSASDTDQVLKSTTFKPDDILRRLNARLDPSRTSLRFFVDESTGKTVFRLIDVQSGKTMLQIPNEQALATVRALDQASASLLSARL
jgi:uncharacterized FlaG/YvyC family protein